MFGSACHGLLIPESGGGGEAWNIHIGDIESGSGAGPTAAANNADNLLKDRKVARRVCVLVCVYIGILWIFITFSWKNVRPVTLEHRTEGGWAGKNMGQTFDIL